MGATGYSGGELLRYLSRHPHASIEYVASRSRAGRPASEFHPHLAGVPELLLEPLDAAAMADRCAVVFTAVPKGASMALAPELLERGVRLIDVGTDFRLRDLAVFQQWYGFEHSQPALLAEAVYGLTEVARDQLKDARLVGNPGCYPTAALLALAPLASADLVDATRVIVTATSGISGAGQSPDARFHLPHATENVQSYGVAGHRHTPEIAQAFGDMAGTPAQVSFVPQLAPMSRGILATAVIEPRGRMNGDELLERYRAFYGDEPFVRVLEDDALPQTKAVAGTNRCDVAVRLEPHTGRAVAVAAIDNLGKGAAGQAVQNLNVMMGWDETAGLAMPGLYP